MSKPEFGFSCGDFSAVLSGNGVILPGSKNTPLRISSVPNIDMHDAAGDYVLRLSVDGEFETDIPVQVVWIAHSSQPEPFLGFKVETTEDVMAILKQHIGKQVMLDFRNKNPSIH